MDITPIDISYIHEWADTNECRVVLELDFDTRNWTFIFEKDGKKIKRIVPESYLQLYAVPRFSLLSLLSEIEDGIAVNGQQ